METLESIRMCRLCGDQLHNTMAIHIFESSENYDKKIRSLLPILVHESDCLPKYLCYNCGEKLREFYNFYFQALKLDVEMKRKLSWMTNNTKDQHNNSSTVYFADLQPLKIESEVENLEKCNTAQLNSDFDSISMESNENFQEEKFNCLPTFSTNNDDGDRGVIDERKRLPLSVTIPLIRIKNELESSPIIRVLDSKDDLVDPRDQSACISTTQKDMKSDYKGINNINFNCYPSIIPEDLIKCETKENDDFIRKLRPRRNLVSDQTTRKAIKKEEIDSTALEIQHRSGDLMADLKLSKKVEIKVEKLDCETVTRNGIATVNSDFDKSKNINYNYPSNIQNILKEPQLLIEDAMHKMKPLRLQNNCKDIERYESKVKIHMKGITVKLSKIDVAQLQKRKCLHKSHCVISKIKKKKRIHETYSCERCHELFTKRELYRLHFCYFHY